MTLSSLYGAAVFFFCLINTNPQISSRVVIPFKAAFTLGKAETSMAPVVSAGLGPRIKNATAKMTTAERIYMIRDQN